MVAYDINNDPLATTSTVFIDNFADLTQTFESGIYQIDHYCVMQASGTVRGVLNIEVDSTEINDIRVGLFSNPEPQALCSTIVALDGEHTIGFKVRTEGGSATVTLRNRYYTITKIA